MSDWIQVPQKQIEFEGGESMEVAPFAISRWPVSVEQFRTFCQATGYQTVAELRGSERTYADNDVLRKFRGRTRKRRPQARRVNDDIFEKPADDLRPTRFSAMCVSHVDALAYCDWAGVELPTEAQWLAASVLNWTERFSGGTDAIDAINRYASHEMALQSVGSEWTRETGRYPDLIRGAARREFLSTLFRDDQRQNGTWAVLRRAPQYILTDDWETVRASLIAPVDFWHEVTTFRVCRPA